MKTLKQIQDENRKFIIMANNPTAKTYDEALKMELGIGCIVFDLQDTINEQTECNYYKIICSSDDDVVFILTSLDEDDSFNDLFTHYNPTLCSYNLLDKSVFKIIGKPLTLSRVLIALSEDFCFYKENKTNLSIAKINQDPDSQIKWDLTKETLEDQSEETQRKFNELIK